MLPISVFNTIVDRLVDFGTGYGLKILGTILILVIGLIICKLILKLVEKAFSKTALDLSLVGFIIKVVDICIKIFIVLSALSNLGISTTGLIAAFSAAAVAVSLALKDSLGNLAGGILMLITRPFSTGDFIAVGSESGKVLKIDIIHTTLLTPDNRQVVIPNGQLANSTITDYSKEARRRVDLTFGISYNDDPEKAKALVMECIKAHPKALKDPEPFVRVSEHADSAVIITARVWCESADYWTVHFDLLEQVRGEFDKNGVSIPYNQLDVHLIDDNK